VRAIRHPDADEDDEQPGTEPAAA